MIFKKNCNIKFLFCMICFFVVGLIDFIKGMEQPEKTEDIELFKELINTTWNIKKDEAQQKILFNSIKQKLDEQKKELEDCMNKAVDYFLKNYKTDPQYAVHLFDKFMKRIFNKVHEHDRYPYYAILVKGISENNPSKECIKSLFTDYHCAQYLRRPYFYRYIKNNESEFYIKYLKDLHEQQNKEFEKQANEFSEKMKLFLDSYKKNHSGSIKLFYTVLKEAFYHAYVDTEKDLFSKKLVECLLASKISKESIRNLLQDFIFDYWISMLGFCQYVKDNHKDFYIKYIKCVDKKTEPKEIIDVFDEDTTSLFQQWFEGSPN